MINQFQCLACSGVYFDRSPEGGTYHHACPPLPPDKNGTVPIRADARNENLTRVRNGQAPTIKSEGAGAKCLTDDRLTEPAWITAVKKRAPVEEVDADE